MVEKTSSSSPEHQQQHQEELSYARDMWDKLIPINQQNKHGISHLNSLKTFSKEFQRLVGKFSRDMQFAIEKWSRQNGTAHFFFSGQESTSIEKTIEVVKSCVLGMCQGLEECS